MLLILCVLDMSNFKLEKQGIIENVEFAVGITSGTGCQK